MESITREFLIVLSKQAALEAELMRLAKRAKRIGAPAIVWSFGAVIQRTVEVRGPIAHFEVEELMGGALPPEPRTELRMVAFVPLTLTGARPKIDGWTFAATIQHLDGANILRSCPTGPEQRAIPEQYRTRATVCDHCQTNRRRRDTFLLVNDAGEWKQVGRSCLVDFFGHADPHALASYAEILAAASALAQGAGEDAEGGWGFGGGASAWSLLEYLACAAAEIRETGWTPKSAVPDRPNKSTAARAKDRMAPERGAEKRDRTVLEADRTVAQASFDWALALEDSGERLNDYLWNLHAVAKSGIVDHRTLGIAASMVAAYTKAETKKRERAERKPSEHVGTVGESRSFALTLDRHLSFETDWGLVSRYLFRDEAGNVFTWKSSSCATVIGLDAPNDRMVEGAQYVVTASIKKHDAYKDTKQTVLTRAAIRPFDSAVFESMRNEEIRKVLGKAVRAGTATAEEQAQYKTLDAAYRAANRRTRAAIAAHAYFESTLRTVHYPCTHDVVDAGHGIWVDYKELYRSEWRGEQGYCQVLESVRLELHIGHKWVDTCDGPDMLDRARLFVAKHLAKAAGAC